MVRVGGHRRRRLHGRVARRRGGEVRLELIVRLCLDAAVDLALAGGERVRRVEAPLRPVGGAHWPVADDDGVHRQVFDRRPETEENRELLAALANVVARRDGEAGDGRQPLRRRGQVGRHQRVELVSFRIPVPDVGGGLDEAPGERQVALLLPLLDVELTGHAAVIDGGPGDGVHGLGVAQPWRHGDGGGGLPAHAPAGDLHQVLRLRLARHLRERERHGQPLAAVDPFVLEGGAQRQVLQLEGVPRIGELAGHGIVAVGARLLRLVAARPLDEVGVGDGHHRRLRPAGGEAIGAAALGLPAGHGVVEDLQVVAVGALVGDHRRDAPHRLFRVVEERARRVADIGRGDAAVHAKPSDRRADAHHLHAADIDAEAVVGDGQRDIVAPLPGRLVGAGVAAGAAIGRVLARIPEATAADDELDLRVGREVLVGIRLDVDDGVADAAALVAGGPELVALRVGARLGDERRIGVLHRAPVIELHLDVVAVFLGRHPARAVGAGRLEAGRPGRIADMSAVAAGVRIAEDAALEGLAGIGPLPVDAVEAAALAVDDDRLHRVVPIDAENADMQHAPARLHRRHDEAGKPLPAIDGEHRDIRAGLGLELLPRRALARGEEPLQRIHAGSKADADDRLRRDQRDTDRDEDRRESRDDGCKDHGSDAEGPGQQVPRRGDRQAIGADDGEGLADDDAASRTIRSPERADIALTGEGRRDLREHGGEHRADIGEAMTRHDAAGGGLVVPAGGPESGIRSGQRDNHVAAEGDAVEPAPARLERPEPRHLLPEGGQPDALARRGFWQWRRPPAQAEGGLALAAAT
ncbi:MAG: hypothetical protein FD152_2114 [Xanthobacteraceae bacterium]|nr:MAG: hypothetical protein FD152_2114 [Xanthobacteraceae bacterium]